jgi:hypothetical protein
MHGFAIVGATQNVTPEAKLLVKSVWLEQFGQSPDPFLNHFSIRI